MKNKFAAIILAGLIFIGLGANLAAAQESKIYTLSLSYDKGDIVLTKDITVLPGYAPDRKIQPETGYKTEVLSLKDEVLYSFKFEAPNRICTDKIDPVTKKLSGGCSDADKADFAIILPYFENGKLINIYDPSGRKVFFANVEYLNQTCGDSVCQAYETYKICSADCPVKVEKEAGVSKGMIAGIIAVIIVVIVAAIIIAKKKKGGNISQ